MLIQVIRDLFSPPAPVAEAAEEYDPAESGLKEAVAMMQSDDLVGAERVIEGLTVKFPEHPDVIQVRLMVHLAIVKAKFPGPDYFAWLQWFHANVKPKTYLEIGVESGQSLRYAQHPTKAVGVDPEIRIVYPQETWVKLFKQPSDDFFAQHDLRNVFEEDNVDLAFIDGLHTFDQALKDFINVERNSHAGTVVLFHDILPAIPITAERDRVSLFWVGDTWKVLLILLKYRPDLNVQTIPTSPSGLGLVTNLDSKNDFLARNLDRIIDEAAAVDLDSHFAEIDKSLNVVANDFEPIRRLLEGLRK